MLMGGFLSEKKVGEAAGDFSVLAEVVPEFRVGAVFGELEDGVGVGVLGEDGVAGAGTDLVEGGVLDRGGGRGGGGAR